VSKLPLKIVLRGTQRKYALLSKWRLINETAQEQITVVENNNNIVEESNTIGKNFQVGS